MMHDKMRVHPFWTRVTIRGALVDKRGRDELLKNHPGLLKVRHGTLDTYLLRGDANENWKFTLEAASSGISIIVQSAEPPTQIRRTALLRLLSLASYLCDSYNFEISSVFPHIVDSLAHDDYVPAVKDLESTTDIVLAKQLIALKKRPEHG